MIAHIYPSVLQAVSGRGYAGCLDGCFQGCQGEAMQDLGYELRRIHIPRTPVNKRKKKGPEGSPAPSCDHTGGGSTTSKGRIMSLSSCSRM